MHLPEKSVLWPPSFASLVTLIQENQLGTHVLGFHLPHAPWPSGHCNGVRSKETRLHAVYTFLTCSSFKCRDKEMVCRDGGGMGWGGSHHLLLDIPQCVQSHPTEKREGSEYCDLTG